MRASISSVEVASKLSIIRFTKFPAAVSFALIAPLYRLNCSTLIVYVNYYIAVAFLSIIVTIVNLNSSIVLR